MQTRKFNATSEPNFRFATFTLCFDYLVTVLLLTTNTAFYFERKIANRRNESNELELREGKKDVINDPLGLTQSPHSSDHYFHFKMILFGAILKSGDGQTDGNVWKQWPLQAVIDCWSAMWIKIHYLVRNCKQAWPSFQSGSKRLSLTVDSFHEDIDAFTEHN